MSNEDPSLSFRPVRLSLRGIQKAFGANIVLDGINLDVREGEVVALLGENGAGKSTLSSIISGLHHPDKGEMLWESHPYAPDTPGDALRSGIALIHQEMKLVPDLSIAENMFIGRIPMRHGRVDRAAMVRRAEVHLKALGLNVSPARMVRGLSIAAQQQVEIAKALTLGARLLILDEPTAALGMAETDNLFAQIRRLRSEGVSFIYVSHRLEEIAQICDRITVLRDGNLVATHESASVPVNVLLRDMVGRSIDRIFPPVSDPGEEEVLRVENLTSASDDFRNINFSVKAGEVFGIAGIVGAGRTELVRAIAGIDPIRDGQVLLEGDILQPDNVGEAIRRGIVLVPEDRKSQGVLLDQSIADNLALGNYDRLAPNGWLPPSKIGHFAKDLIQRLGVKGDPEQKTRALSGGNQQKVVIARWLAREPKVFILDEPTRGIDMGARAAIYELIARLAANRMAVIVVSSDLEEVLGLSHRVMVLAGGRQMGILPRNGANSVNIMEMATA
ncbi:sugar ABC transporter ATP-binding protein [Asaia prunellae]|uniref:sugar ABC transporter ATP-binding protein n=1 Tax=Asaia prunellae TaxID=610245 RepID=UPI00046FD0E6|nr:sugar ABC transporter ATP-binding protein [Asaia prunellae]